VLYYWASGTTLTATVMFLSMFYITVEWCQQSFLSTEDYDDAMQGLRMTRSYRQYTYFIRVASRFIAQYTLNPLEWLAYKIGLIKTTQQTIFWTKQHTWEPRVPTRLMPPAFELTDLSDGPSNGPQMQETPALAHSLFPPAIPMGRPRAESDTSFEAQSLRQLESHGRISDDSYAPLVQRPSEAHRAGQHADRSSSDQHRISTDNSAIVVTPPEDEAPFQGWLGLHTALQPRHAYRRANSDPGSPPLDLPQPNLDPLGIHLDVTDLERGVVR